MPRTNRFLILVINVGEYTEPPTGWKPVGSTVGSKPDQREDPKALTPP